MFHLLERFLSAVDVIVALIEPVVINVNFIKTFLSIRIQKIGPNLKFPMVFERFLSAVRLLFDFNPYIWFMQSSLKFNQGLPVNSLLYQNFLTTSFFCIFCQNWCSFS